MGMFDDVYDVEGRFPCSWCGSAIPDFKSKSGECSLRSLSIEQFLMESNPATIYNYCPKCKVWNEFEVKFPVIPDIEVKRIK